MRNLFKGYYKPSEEEFGSLWANAVFVFDTNVLLNLYRYQSSTRDSLLTVIERLTDRVWIPYHVGLEFQRNRLTVIAEQHKRYTEVQNIVANSISGMQSQLENLQLKKRHSHINPDQLIENIEKVKSGFISELKALEEKSISVTSDDEIREKIDSLFDGKVGSPPVGQEEIDELFKEADTRYKNAIPPGFEDSVKDEKSRGEFAYGGITYKRKYGDLIVWKQIIKQAENESLKDVIFITDDNKSDWWWKIDSNGKKTIGVRPELTDELTREAGVERFYVYTTDNFLSYANEYLDAEVTDETIEEVREVTVANQNLRKDFLNSVFFTGPAEEAVLAWLSHSFPNVKVNHQGFPDFISYEGGRNYGFIVKPAQDLRSVISAIHAAEIDFVLEDTLHELVIFIVVLNEEEISIILEKIHEDAYQTREKIKLIIGRVEVDEGLDIGFRFIPRGEIRLNDKAHRGDDFLELSKLAEKRNNILRKYE